MAIFRASAQVSTLVLSCKFKGIAMVITMQCDWYEPSRCLQSQEADMR